MLFFYPIFVKKIWGGNRLSQFFSKNDLANQKIGEAYIASDSKNFDSLIKKGKFKGKTLSWIWNYHKEFFNNYPSANFPLLIKLIDANDDLSVQVHPSNLSNDCQCIKNECWYFLDCPKDHSLVLGHYARNKDDFLSLFENKKYYQLFRKIIINKDDFVFIPAGTVHAILKDSFVFEIQNNCDITYRIFDYNRVDPKNKKPRALHTEKALEAIYYPQNHLEKEKNSFFPLTKNIEMHTLLKNDFFDIKKIVLKDNAYINLSFEKNFIYFFCSKGKLKINENDVSETDSGVICHDDLNSLTIEGNGILFFVLK
ncbi:class I mannose-6-phosphate isomerase [symbiont of Argiope bruennichi]|uniref:type I phosphomannose isomerase catalytic subunit n=1 Tax=symbiont of Argiope bruennichi TaxID=2810479 RepID=UPI003DA489D2